MKDRRVATRDRREPPLTQMGRWVWSLFLAFWIGMVSVALANGIPPAWEPFAVFLWVFLTNLLWLSIILGGVLKKDRERTEAWKDRG